MTKMKQRSFGSHRTAGVLIALVLMATLCVLRPGSINAQGSRDDYTGVDVVFLVDQSGSMGGLVYGSADHPVANDPNDLRFSGLEEMVERLVGYRVNYFRGSQVQFQTAVIYFGSQIRQVVPLTLVAPNTSEEWEPQAARIGPVLSPAAFRTNLGNTDHLSALKAAKGVLQAMEQSWPAGRHLQVILMLTDGESYLDCTLPEQASQNGQPTPTPPPQPPYCRDGRFQLSVYRNMMRDFISQELPAPHHLFYVAAINRDLRQLDSFWKDITGNRAELVDAATMWAFFEKMLADLTVNEPRLSAKKTTEGEAKEITEKERVPVRPYLQEITFKIHKPAPQVRVKLLQNGVSLESLPTTITKDKDKYIESITVRNPRPGFIDIERPQSTGILRIFMISIGANIKCDKVGDVPQFIPLRLRCSVQGQYGPLPPYEEASYQLAVEAEIHSQAQSQRLSLRPQGQSAYGSYFVPAQAGDYTFVITAKTRDPDGKEFAPFRESAYGVGDFTVKRTAPRFQADTAPTALLPVPVTVRLTDAAGAELRVAPEAEPYVRMEALFAIGAQETPVSLQSGARGYGGVFAPLQPGSYQVRLRGQVQDPVTGDRLTAYNQEIGALEVLPPKVVWKGFSSPWPQYRPASLSFTLSDQSNQPLAGLLASDIELQAEAYVKGGASTAQVALKVAEKGSWQGEYVPDNAGEYTLYVTISARARQPQQVILVQNAPLFQFSIRPMTLVHAEIRQPQNQAAHAWRDILWQPRSLDIEVVLVDKYGKPVNPALALRNPTDTPLAASLVPPGGGAGQSLLLKQGRTPGQFTAVYEDYQPFRWYAHRDLGWYEVLVKPRGELNEAHTFGASSAWSVRVHLVRHPLWWLLPLLVFTGVVALAVWMAWLTYLHLWPAVGTLSVEGGVVWTRTLREYRKHTLAFKEGLPASIREIRIHRPLGGNYIKLSVQLKNGAWSLRNRIAHGGFRAPLGGSYAITYSSTAGEKSSGGLVLGPAAAALGLLTTGLLAGLGFIIYAVISSLAG
jgi:hypothetical protein